LKRPLPLSPTDLQFGDSETETLRAIFAATNPGLTWLADRPFELDPQPAKLIRHKIDPNRIPATACFPWPMWRSVTDRRTSSHSGIDRDGEPSPPPYICASYPAGAPIGRHSTAVWVTLSVLLRSSRTKNSAEQSARIGTVRRHSATPSNSTSFKRRRPRSWVGLPASSAPASPIAAEARSAVRKRVERERQSARSFVLAALPSPVTRTRRLQAVRRNSRSPVARNRQMTLVRERRLQPAKLSELTRALRAR
jgi:hypothetical protein